MTSLHWIVSLCTVSHDVSYQGFKISTDLVIINFSLSKELCNTVGIALCS